MGDDWKATAFKPTCVAYFGSHACDLERGHDGPHTCLLGHEERPFTWERGQGSGGDA